ncbi:hypothetical protein ACJJTC_016242 [Scirpophaga incertulas]
MPKRSAQEKLERYERKIRKIQQQEESKRRRLHRVLYSSDEENLRDIVGSETSAVQIDRPSKPETPVLENYTDELEEPLKSLSTDQAPATTVAAEAPETEPALDPDLLLALGASTSESPDFGDAVHESLATLWHPILRKGLPKEEKEKLTKEYLIPVNCKLLQSPTLNPEIAAAASEIVRGRDKKLASFQQTLGLGISAVNQAMDTLLKSDNKSRALKQLSNSCRLLTDLHFSFTKDRIKLVVPSLEKNIVHVIHDVERDETLFGNSLGEKIKACKAIEKQGSQIRKTNMQNRSNAASQPSTSRPAQQGNWTGPPRYPSIRGGRGGQQRPASRVNRRSYPSTSSQTAPKNFSHPKTRANVQH